MDSYLKDLNRFCKSVEKKYPTINSGGCGFFAATLGKHLAKHFPVALRVGSSWIEDAHDMDINDIRPNVSNNTVADWNGYDVIFGHVIVELIYDGKKYHVDTSGVHRPAKRDPTFRFPLYQGEFTIKEMEELTKEMSPDDWNASFPRKAIRPIKSMTTSFFKNQASRYHYVY